MINTSEQTLHSMLDQYDHPVFLLDDHQHIHFLNQTAQKIFDHQTPIQIGGCLPFKLDSRKISTEMIPFSDGASMPVVVSSDNLTWNDRQYQLVSVKQTARQEPQDSAQNQAALFKTIADYTYDWEYFLLPDQTLRYISPSCKRITGYSAADFLHRPDLLASIVHPRDSLRFSRHLEKTASARKVSSIEFRIFDRTGKEHWIGQKCQPVFLENGHYIGCRVSNREITNEKRYQQKLQDNLRMLRGILIHSNHGILLVDSHGGICEWNSHQERFTGLKKSDIIGKSFLESRKQFGYIALDGRPTDEISEEGVYEILQTGRGKLIDSTFDWLVKKDNDPDRYIQEHYFSISTEGGYQLGCISRDITSIKNSSLQLENMCAQRTRELRDEVAIRQQTEIELTRHLEIEHCLSKISRLFIQNVNLKETIPQVLKRLAGSSQADYVSLYINNRTGDEIETIYQWMSPSGASRRVHPNSLSFESVFSSFIQELREGRIVEDDDPASCGRYLLEGQPSIPEIKSSVLVPVNSIREFLAVIKFDYRENHNGGAEKNNRILEIVAQIIGGALERGRIMDALEHQVKDRTQDIHILFKIASLVSQPMDVCGILKSSLDIVMDSPINIGAGFIHFHGDQNESVVLAHSKNIPEESARMISENFKIDAIREKLISSMRPILIPDLRRQTGIPVEICMEQYYSYIGIPIWVKGHLQGVLSLIGESFDDLTLDNITLLSAVGDQIGGAIEGECLRARAKEAAVIEERQRLARELHDSVTQYLYSLILLIKGWKRDVDTAKSNDEIKAWFGQAGEITSMALKEMRLLLYTLHPQTMLDREGLIGSINRYLEKMEIQGKMKTTFKVDSNIELPPDVQYELFRIVQESLTNVIKHAQATKLTVTIKNARDYVELEIIDNGIGFDPSSLRENRGLGIMLMRERANNIHSTISISSKPGEGTKITIRVDT